MCILDCVNGGELRTIIAAGETLCHEFKRTVDDRELTEAVVCLANGEGGLVLVGVDDDGTVIGADPRHGDRTDPTRVEAMIRNKTHPPVTVSVEIVAYGDAQVLAVHVPMPPTVTATSDGRFIRRVIGVTGRPECLPMRPDEVLSHAGTIGASDYSMIPVGEATIEHDLEPREFDRMRSLAASDGDGTLGGLSDLEILRALRFVSDAGVLTVGAILVFGTEAALRRWVPNYEIGYQELEQLKVRTSSRLRVPLLRAMSELFSWVEQRNPQEEVDVGLLRVPLPRFASVAVRELIANALVHRDFSQVGPTLVELDDGSLQISNPGGFPAGVTIDNLLRTPPRARNPGLADAFKRAGLVEQTSRGINRAFQSQLSLGRSAPDYGRTSPSSVIVRLRSGPSDKDIAAFVAGSRVAGNELALHDLLALHEVRSERRITTSRAAELFQVDDSEARVVLNRLVETGLLEARGERKGRTYHLAAGLYRRLGEPAEYLRTRGYDDIQQAQMVLAFVERHGQITRGDAAALCQLESAAAGRLLRKLRDQGQLVMIGERKGARYVLPGGDA